MFMLQLVRLMSWNSRRSRNEKFFLPFSVIPFPDCATFIKHFKAPQRSAKNILAIGSEIRCLVLIRISHPFLVSCSNDFKKIPENICDGVSF